tara:strand:- start:1729 stop:1983 length:255 start_codon:yes stop_codon:yes gene_type:complete
MDHKVTHRNDTHVFWRTYECKQVLYQITKKGEPMPHTGYYYPEHLLFINGYSSLDVEKTFDMSGKKILRLSNNEKAKTNSIKKT